jgi:hypothetical protein
LRTVGEAIVILLYVMLTGESSITSGSDIQHPQLLRAANDGAPIPRARRAVYTSFNLSLVTLHTVLPMPFRRPSQSALY